MKVGTAIIVYDSKGRILMGERKGGSGQGCWSIPGGSLDEGETPLEGAKRELEEETGLAPPKGSLVSEGWSHSTWEDKDKGHQEWLTLYFSVRLLESEEPKLMEPNKCVGWEWVATQDLQNKYLFPPLHNYLQWHSLRRII